MDIKETGSVRASSDKSSKEATESVLDRNPNGAPLRAQLEKIAITDAVKSSITRNQNNSADFRLRANQVIEAVNVADSATSEIKKLADSISGIVDQASDPKTPQARIAVLQREANQLVSAIKSQVNKTTESGVQPLAGDQIQLVVEKELGKTLSFLLPADGKENFGLGTVEFSTLEAIIQTRQTVANARARIEELRGAVDTTRGAVTTEISRAEVALQNSEAANSSVRDVDSALELLTDTSDKIRSSPDTALDSVGQLRGNTL
jgi:flagellin-like hook-associated protein FlgL